MPWGLPRTFDDPRSDPAEVWSFLCSACRTELFAYTPFCPECGCKHPRENKAFGTTGRSYRRFWKLPELTAALESYRGWTAEVGSFVISHRELAIPLWSDGKGSVLVYCSAVERIEVTPGRWDANLRVEPIETELGAGFALLDDTARLRVVCGMLSLLMPGQQSGPFPEQGRDS